MLTLGFLLAIHLLGLVLSFIMDICDSIFTVVDVAGSLARTLLGPLDILIGWDVSPATLLLLLPLTIMVSRRSYFTHNFEGGRYAGQ